jgi:hypothetical protein
VLGALRVCSVPKTKWPVSASVSADSMVSKMNKDKGARSRLS